VILLHEFVDAGIRMLVEVDDHGRLLREWLGSEIAGDGVVGNDVSGRAEGGLV
jgi:hypothetical protein